MCRGRGLSLDRVNPEDDLLLPPSGLQADIDDFKSLLDHYAVRLLLKEIIKSEDQKAWIKGRRSVERFCNPEAVDSFLDRLRKLGVIIDSDRGQPVPSSRIRSFGATYEWHVAGVLSRDFSCPSAWGVRFSNMGSGGDHDVIASVSGRFLYMEIKTSPPKHIEQPETSGFVRRLLDVAPDICIFHNDTHLRMKDKIVPMLEDAITILRNRPNVQRPTFNVNGAGFQRLEREIFHLGSCIYVVNSKPDLKRNLTTVFRHYFRARSNVLEFLT